MNKSYCDKISENLTTFITECIFVGSQCENEKVNKQ